MIRIDTAKISAEQTEINQEEDPALLELNTVDIDFVSPLAVSCKVIRIDDNLNVNGLFRAKVRFRCSRCVERFFSQVKGKFNFDYPIKEEILLDITNDIREEVILSYPAVLCCSKNCKGLCIYCGRNLNKGKCSCKVENISNKFSKLKEWKG
ncbi:MAG: DUF177 domain-containing protein [Candidatus Omnitrophota bacterium]|nr:DUF177 domain-containing protein [Candidatus Omnitrophota bacterium]